MICGSSAQFLSVADGEQIATTGGCVIIVECFCLLKQQEGKRLACVLFDSCQQVLLFDVGLATSAVCFFSMVLFAVAINSAAVDGSCENA